MRLSGAIPIVAVILVLEAGFGIPQQRPAPKLPNGFYSILIDTTSRIAARIDSIPNSILIYDGRYTDSSDMATPRYVAVDTTFYVPLVLEGAPVAKKDGNGRTLLGVSLSQRYVKRLADFTKAHLGGRVAIVLDGEVITMHKIRSVISGGKIQITRCYDNACEVLLSKLVK
jgi:preprotein translocase subunit SecD